MKLRWRRESHACSGGSREAQSQEDGMNVLLLHETDDDGMCGVVVVVVSFRVICMQPLLLHSPKRRRGVGDRRQCEKFAKHQEMREQYVEDDIEREYA